MLLVSSIPALHLNLKKTRRHRRRFANSRISPVSECILLAFVCRKPISRLRTLRVASHLLSLILIKIRRPAVYHIYLWSFRPVSSFRAASISLQTSLLNETAVCYFSFNSPYHLLELRRMGRLSIQLHTPTFCHDKHYDVSKMSRAY